MSINYAQLRKTGRGQSVNTDFTQYHKLSQNKTFTESFPLSLKQAKHNFKNQLSTLDFDNHQIDIKNHPFTFQEKTEQKTEATKKKFVFDDHQPTKPGELKKFMNAMDEYIDFLNESQESVTNNYGDVESVIFAKFNLIRQKHDELNKKYKAVQQNYKAQKYQNHILKQQILDLHSSLEEERKKNYMLVDHNTRLAKKNKQLQYRLINQSSIEDSSQQITHETNISNEDSEQVTKFLKSQMRKLKHNNQQIDDYSRLYKKYSEHNNDDF